MKQLHAPRRESLELKLTWHEPPVIMKQAEQMQENLKLWKN